METITNRQMAQSDTTFIDCCKQANVKPTVRQASKFRMGKGAAYKIAIKGQKDVHVPDFAKMETKSANEEAMQ
jgi:hypothetical protein